MTIALALTFAWLSIATEHPALALAIVGAFVAWALFRATRAIEQRGRG